MIMCQRSLVSGLRAGRRPFLALRRTFSSVLAPPTAWNTKIVCTLGPASNTEERLEEMVNAGMGKFLGTLLYVLCLVVLLP